MLICNWILRPIDTYSSFFPNSLSLIVTKYMCRLLPRKVMTLIAVILSPEDVFSRS